MASSALAGPPAIEVQDFAAAYEGHRVLHDVNFKVDRGEVLFIAGDSGSGKSTMLRHMIGLQQPAAGRILIDGEDLAATPEGPERERILRKFGVSFQSGALFGDMTILENVKLPLAEFARITGSVADSIALTKLHLVGLAESASKLPSELSGGMQKRAAIARALALDPQIVFMDEPSAGLDPITSADLDQLIKSLNELLNTTFVIVSHELASIHSIAHRVLLFSGRCHTIVASGKPDQLAGSSTDPWVRSFFNRTASQTPMYKNAPPKPSPERTVVGEPS